MSTTLRRGDEQDLGTLLAFFDEAVAWMVARGQPDQWGTEPWSANPKRVERVRALIGSGELWIAELDGVAAGALIVSDHADEHVPTVDEPERYVRLLITSRALAGNGIGSLLLDKAKDIARADGIELLRVDCWAGGGGKLVAYYERNGFAKSGTFTVKGWPGQVLTQRVTV
ncbi:GNAT family N-acetyltransferase [Labedaea rhizosphaerae]|uniref:Acetyltransferase (GNAT) family protein n=1 Tax=Labedaea rhizosphaerae TaxID=598644 RepID=A0A4V3CX55_LABRH|nr:GNAT family N-acetyltransferase [Labedaea rhizosphaerae]TDP88958.1 acetyltransferase (GNAT) family protein [Labedaea rhizosphaerae]